MKYIKIKVENGKIMSDVDVRGLSLSENSLLVRELEILKLFLLDFDYVPDFEVGEDEEDD